MLRDLVFLSIAHFITSFVISIVVKPLITMSHRIIVSANVSVRRPLKPEQRKPGGAGSDQKVPLPLPPKMHDSSVGVKKAPGSSRKSPEKKGSKRFEQEQAVQRAPSAVRPATSYQSRRNDDGAAGVTAIAGTQTKADVWEKEKLARVREE